MDVKCSDSATVAQKSKRLSCPLARNSLPLGPGPSLLLYSFFKTAWGCWNAKQTQHQVFLSFSICLSRARVSPFWLLRDYYWVLWCHGNCLIPFSQVFCCQRSGDPKTLLSLILCLTLFLTRMLSNALRKFIWDALVSVLMMDSFPLCWPYWFKGRGRERNRGEKEGNMGVVRIFILWGLLIVEQKAFQTSFTQ